MKRSQMPPRSKRMERGGGLEQGAGLKRRVPLRAGTGKPSGGPKTPSPYGSLSKALRFVLACEMTVAEASRVHECDRDALEQAARKACRAATMERDHWTCLNCGRLAQDVQHRIRRGMGGTSDTKIAFSMVNQVGMCRPCHLRAEARDELMHARGFWLEVWEDPAAVPVAILGETGRSLRWLLTDGTWSAFPPEVSAA